MTESIPELARMVDQLDSATRQLAEYETRCAEIARQLEEFTYTWRAPDEQLTVTVTGAGTLLEVRPSAELLASPHVARIANRIRDGILSARVRVNRESQAIWRPLFVSDQSADAALSGIEKRSTDSVPVPGDGRSAHSSGDDHGYLTLHDLGGYDE